MAENNDVVKVGDKEFVIGKPSPAQIVGITRAFAKLQLGARKSLSDITDAGDMDYIMAFLANIDEETLVNLAALSIGSDKKFAVDNFDLVWVTQALGILIRKSSLAQVVANFTSILSPAADTQE